MDGKCRSCGCTESNACVLPAARLVPEGEEVGPAATCSWDQADLCTACVFGASPRWIHPAQMNAAGAQAER